MHVTNAIQVTESLVNQDTRKREINGLLNAAQQYGLEDGLILTDNEHDDLMQGGINIQVRPIWFWMLCM